jgi:hypothetical protein
MYMFTLGREDLDPHELVKLAGMEAVVAAAAGTVAVAEGSGATVLDRLLSVGDLSSSPSAWAVGATCVGLMAVASCVNDVVLAIRGGVN